MRAVWACMPTGPIPIPGFLIVSVGLAERWDRLWLVCARAYYWLNVPGWDVEARGTAHHWRANNVKTRTHALWRLGHWALTHGGSSWRAIYQRNSQVLRNKFLR